VNLLLVMARRQGNYMNRPVVGFFTLLLLASNIWAQGAVRRRDVSRTGVVADDMSFDSTDIFRPRLESPPAPASVTPIPVSQLRIPSKALKEFERATKAFRSGEIKASAEHLQKALQIYPDFIDAHNALGLRYTQIGEYQKAVAEHEIALSLNPRNAQTHQDLAFALLLLNRYQEAEAEARDSLDIDPQPAAPRYFLARALIGQGRVTPEVIQMLRQSEDAFPNASLVLAQIHFEQGRTEEVIAALRHYLQATPDPENKQKAECWVARLRQQPVPAGCSSGLTRPSFR